MIAKKLLIVSGFMAVLLLAASIQGASAATNLPSYLTADQKIDNYSMVYNDTMTVYNIDSSNPSTSTNVTCYTSVWYRAGNATVNASIIGASMVDQGGNILNKAIDLTKTDYKTLIVVAALEAAGLNLTTIYSIKSVWDLMVALLQLFEVSGGYNVTDLNLANTDHALLIGITGIPILSSILFASKGDYMLLALDFDIAQWAVDWAVASNVTDHGALIVANFQIAVWWFWAAFGVVLTALGELATILLPWPSHPPPGFLLRSFRRPPSWKPSRVGGAPSLAQSPSG